MVVTHWPDVQKVVPLYFVPQRHGGYTETFMSAREVWEVADRVIVLNGDVLWHPDVLKFVLFDTGSPRLYGDALGQIYGWAFDKADTEKIVRAVKPLVTQRGPSYSQVHFLRRLAGKSQLRESACFRVVPGGTYTRDFDIAKDYAAWLKQS